MPLKFRLFLVGRHKKSFRRDRPWWLFCQIKEWNRLQTWSRSSNRFSPYYNSHEQFFDHCDESSAIQFLKKQHQEKQRRDKRSCQFLSNPLYATGRKLETKRHKIAFKRKTQDRRLGIAIVWVLQNSVHIVCIFLHIDWIFFHYLSSELMVNGICWV